MRISLRAGERIYVNGAVLRVDRKVALELLNDVTFLLESQVLQVEDATTPLRQLYFIVQLMLMSPADVGDTMALFRRHLDATREVVENADMRNGLASVETLIAGGRPHEALKVIRGLFPVEQAILAGVKTDRPVVAA